MTCENGERRVAPLWFQYYEEVHLKNEPKSCPKPYNPNSNEGIVVFHARRWPRLALGPVVSPIRPCVPPCGAGVARSRCRGWSRGASESRSKTGHSKTDSKVKIQSETTTFVSVL